MEYEYAYKVTNLDEYLAYLNANFKYVEEYEERRTIYRNPNNTNARITYKKGKMTLDFKENKLSNEDLIVRKESKAIVFDNLNACEDILSFLGYIKDNSMLRNRIIYTGDNIKFEIDKYIEPEEAYVFSFEGDKDICDKVNEDLKELNNKYKKED
jgi:adenylate cyclase class IV